MPEGPLRDPWELRFGARVLPGGGVQFRVWAPRLQTIALQILQSATRTIPMSPEAAGEFTATVPDLAASTDYSFILGDGRERPDPVSRWQPAGVHGPSRVVDPHSFVWSDQDWKGIAFRQLVIYELHVGTFTPEGTFEAIIPRLHYLRQLGITAVELMPVAEFPGARNWGYDGACLYAPHSAYGGPAGLQRLVDACHRAGLAVVLDVVYNHFGPEGNYLGDFAPIFTARYHAPWGDAVNFDGADSDGIRRFFVDNALYWLTEYHVDALRLDAVHEIFDGGSRHFLAELAESFHGQAERLGRSAWIIAESDLNDVRIIEPRSRCGFGIDAQWHDDFHHSLHAVVTGDKRGYLADFGTLEDLRKSICDGFVYDGKYSAYRRRCHGSSSKERPGSQFVVYVQNHDQVANACLGARLSIRVSPEQQKLAGAVVLCSPCIPMIFMGQEYGETAPFFFFTSFDDPKLAQAVREGRRREYAAFYSDREFPEPQAPATFERSRLCWPLMERSPHAGILRFYQDLVALRKQHNCLSNCRKDLTSVDLSTQAKWLVIERRDSSASRALLVCNFSSGSQSIPILYDDCDWRLALWSGASQYGGRLGESEPPALLRKRAEAPLHVVTAGYGAILFTST
ncbi:MAG: malto-oligosyltrehalose trehalohydrolase [Acidobacteriia bacterium]|nr:malto-oligosyltrehalose trehalohydrolase [Terriglobia bacterium]